MPNGPLQLAAKVRKCTAYRSQKAPVAVFGAESIKNIGCFCLEIGRLRGCDPTDLLYMRTLSNFCCKLPPSPGHQSPKSPKNKAPAVMAGAQKKSLGWVKGFEPSISRATIWRLNQLGHTHHVAARLARASCKYTGCARGWVDKSLKAPFIGWQPVALGAG